MAMKALLIGRFDYPFMHDVDGMAWGGFANVVKLLVSHVALIE
jgi:hypothetical protein